MMFSIVLYCFLYEYSGFQKCHGEEESFYIKKQPRMGGVENLELFAKMDFLFRYLFRYFTSFTR